MCVNAVAAVRKRKVSQKSAGICLHVTLEPKVSDPFSVIVKAKMFLYNVIQVTMKEHTVHIKDFVSSSVLGGL